MATINTSTDYDDLDLYDNDNDPAKAAEATAVRHVIEETERGLVIRQLHLTEKHATEFDQALDDWIAPARVLGHVEILDKAPRRRSTGGGGGNGLNREDAKAAREWAGESGAQVAAGGRIPNEVSEAWRTGDVERVKRWEQTRREREQVKAQQTAAGAQN